MDKTMKMLYENKVTKVQIALLPKHNRTILFIDQATKFVEIPESYVIYSKSNDIGFVVDKQLTNYITFGSDICLNGYFAANIYEYVDWYWNSKFTRNSNTHSVYYQNLCKQYWYGEPLHFLFIKNNMDIIHCGCDWCLRWNINELNNFVEV